MRIDGFHIKNFLSLGALDWTNLDPHFNIIVGPNGSGKTNLIHALRAVKDIINTDSKQKSLWSQSAYRGSDQVVVEIELDVRFTEKWEKELLGTLLAAALCNNNVITDAFNRLSNAGTQIQLDRETAHIQLAGYLQERVSPEDIEWLFTGRLVVVYRGVGIWTFWYESRPNTQHFRINLDGSSFYDDSVLSRYLPLLLSKQDRYTRDDDLLLNGISMITPRPSLHVEYAPTPLATHQAFERLIGTPLKSDRFYGPAFVFHLLLERALVFSDNIRSHPLYKFSYNDLHVRPVDLSSGEQLARFLFLIKNGSEAERQQYKAIHELFFKITGRSFDVGFDQSAPSALPSTEEQSASLIIHVSSDWGDIPLAFSGAGRAEALFICTLIASRDEQIILLDEPALNMHVTMQKMILNELQAAHGNQYFLVTHSPTLVPPESILKISRFYLHQGYTCRATLSRGSLRAEEFSRLENELRLSTDARAMLFSRGVILVEGGTEQGALPAWLEKRFGSPLENDDILVYSVNGDDNFGIFIHFLHQFHISWAIVCDGKVIGDRIASKTASRIVRQLKQAEIPHLPDCNGKDFSQLCQELEACGVCTHSEDVDDEIEKLPVIVDHQGEVPTYIGNSKIRQAHYIATHYNCPDEIAHLLEKAISHIKKQEC